VRCKLVLLLRLEVRLEVELGVELSYKMRIRVVVSVRSYTLRGFNRYCGISFYTLRGSNIRVLRYGLSKGHYSARTLYTLRGAKVKMV